MIIRTLWSEREDRRRLLRQLAPVLGQEPSRVLVPAAEVQRAAENDAVVGRQILDHGGAAKLDLEPLFPEALGDRLRDFFCRAVLAPVGD